jgi:hypothetical protein
MIRMLSAIVGASERARGLVTTLEAGFVQARSRADCLPKRPRVFFEEWDDPLISGLGGFLSLSRSPAASTSSPIVDIRARPGTASCGSRRWWSEHPISLWAHGAVRNSALSTLRRGRASRKIPAVQHPGPAWSYGAS